MNLAYQKNIRRTITRSLGRYVAIFAIIALGVGFFAGLRQTKPAMIVTLDQYVQEYRLFDSRVLSTIGFTAEEIAKVAGMNGVAEAAGSVSDDFIYVDEEGNAGVLRAHMLMDGVNLPDLRAGRMPEAADEVLLDASSFPESMIGTTIRVAEENHDSTKSSLAYAEYKVSGLARSAYYLNTERGTTTLGNGRLKGFAYVPEEGFSIDYYKELYVTMKDVHESYSDAYDQAVDAWQEELEAEIRTLLEERYELELTQAREEIAEARTELASKIETAEDELAVMKIRLDDALAEIERAEQQLAVARVELEMQELELKEAERTLRLQLDLASRNGGQVWTTPIVTALSQVEAGLHELAEGRDELANRESQLAEARREWTDGYEEYELGLHELEEERLKAEMELREAEEELEAFQAPDLYVLSRDTNTGYYSFWNDASTVEGVGKVFPVFFFLIAALVCSTTMTRMVDDERTQIGTLRALGYSDSAIMGKYLIYAGSAAVLGCIAGYLIGIFLFPQTIWQAYGIIYGFADIWVVGDTMLFAVSLAVSLLCSVGTAYVACRNELRHMPAELIRPKAPPAGKRILLERFGFLWKRMKFLHKITARNIFRYKKRMFMMILGIAGCMALVVTGYGLRDSIMNIVGYQFDEIMHHDVSVAFADPLTEERVRAVLADVEDEVVHHAVLLETSVDALRDMSESGKTVYLIATDDPAIEDFVSLKLGGKAVDYPGIGETVLSQKLAEVIGVKVGDTAMLRYGEEKIVTLTVSGIFENYVQHYAYVSAETFTQSFDEPYEPRTIYLMLREGTDPYTLAAGLMEREDTASTSVVQSIRDSVESTMGRMNYVVLLVIACAGALAFIVLFNLTNINITERVREIATLKVLGFFPNETRSYVFRENIVLSGMGIIAGLPLGVFLHRFVMDQINIDIVSFDVTILPLSYVYSVLTVLAFTVLVNLLMNRKIERISMAESLKSIE